MNIRKKASIIGGIWGLVAIIAGIANSGEFLRSYSLSFLSIPLSILAIPAKVSMWFFGIIFLPFKPAGDCFGSACMSGIPYMILGLFFTLIGSILIGILIGYGIAKIYLKVKQDKSQLKKNT